MHPLAPRASLKRGLTRELSRVPIASPYHHEDGPQGEKVQELPPFSNLYLFPPLVTLSVGWRLNFPRPHLHRRPVMYSRGLERGPP